VNVESGECELAQARGDKVTVASVPGGGNDRSTVHWKAGGRKRVEPGRYVPEYDNWWQKSQRDGNHTVRWWCEETRSVFAG
jgi:hypothetical protein